MIFSRSNNSKLANATAQPNGFPVYVWPWKKVLNSLYSPRKAEKISSVVKVAANGKYPPVIPFAKHKRPESTPKCSQGKILQCGQNQWPLRREQEEFHYAGRFRLVHGD